MLEHYGPQKKLVAPRIITLEVTQIFCRKWIKSEGTDRSRLKDNFRKMQNFVDLQIYYLCLN